jgi:hypothetical protein
MAEKTHDISVVVGTYERDGETKKRRKTIGSVMRSDNGSFLLLDRTFNLAAIPSDRDTVLCSLFKVDEPETVAASPENQYRPAPKKERVTKSQTESLEQMRQLAKNTDDEIPF